ncbi:MAG TPA: 50S ribosomal protein L18 [Candidatus Kapabacteria bacterium]|nr:50S ribosomal protein L18 [Candidatus Kapabacteria bacterium]
MSAKGKIQRRSRRKFHIRKKVAGTAERPRLTVFRSLKHIYVQAIDDVSGRTVAQASSLNDAAVTSLLGEANGKIAPSMAVGKAIAGRLKEQNIATAVFDRNGYLYHGRVKAVADGAREAGLQL